MNTKRGMTSGCVLVLVCLRKEHRRRTCRVAGGLAYGFGAQPYLTPSATPTPVGAVSEQKVGYLNFSITFVAEYKITLWYGVFSIADALSGIEIFKQSDLSKVL